MNNERKNDQKLAYRTPELNRLGSLSSMTAGGPSGMAENTGADAMLDRMS